MLMGWLPAAFHIEIIASTLKCRRVRRGSHRNRVADLAQIVTMLVLVGLLSPKRAPVTVAAQTARQQAVLRG